MKKKGIVMILFIILCGIMISGCGKLEDSTNPFQAPAESNGEQADINKALDELLPQGTEYLTAKNTEQKQSIFIEDINQDGKKEAFVLYRDLKENHQVHMMVLQENNGSWIKLSDIGTNFNTLDYFKLEDLGGNGNKEVILGVALSDTDLEKQIYIYEVDGKDVIEKVNHTYEGVDIADYNEDNISDLLLVDGEINKLQTVELFDYKENKLQSLSLVDLNSDGIPENMVSGKLVNGKKALFIDSGLGAHSMLTEIVTYDNGKLIKVGDANDGIMMKEYPLYSKDINADGIIEVGGMYISKGYEDAAFAEIPFIDTYTDYSIDGTKQTIEERYTDSSQHFYITIPSNWQGKVTINRLENGVQILSNADQKVLFEVKWMKKEADLGSGTKLGETKDSIFFTDLKESMAISNDHFHLLEDEFE